MKQLDPKAVWLFFIGSVVWFLVLVILMIVPITIALLLVLIEGGTPNLKFINFIGSVLGSGYWEWISVIAVIVLDYVWSKLKYKYYRYEVSEAGLKTESGIINKSYVTVPFERIQNVDIFRSWIHRILSLSDLSIQTAGVGSVVGEATLPGLSREVAEQLRAELISKSKLKHQGL
jgi:membrane protein YdbS with pleckstrin-like domain